MNKRTEILLHIAAWAVLLLTPLSFMNHGNGVSLQQFLMMSVSPLTMMVVFYLNYFWLTPKLFVEGEKKYFWAINVVLCIALGTALHYWMAYACDFFDTNRRHIFILRDIFNLMVAAAIATTIQLSLRWHKSEEARHKAEVAHAEAELRNLRNQISPHFLLNTLNNIYALTAFDTQKAQDAIQQLSKLLRHMLYDNQQDMVDWNDEIQFLESYVSLMKIRLPQSVDVSFSSTLSSLMPPKVAPLLFISLVENAFKHGVSPTEPSFVHINLNADNQQMVCHIENSNHPKTEQDRSGHGIGLQQVQRRLDLSYPGRYKWEKGPSADGAVYQSTITIVL